MAAYKDKKHGTWFVRFRYKDYTGRLRQTTKRGFRTKKEAQDYERKRVASAAATCDILFNTFCDEYLDDCKVRLKESSYISTRFYIENHIRPAFAERKLSDITASDIRRWENALLHKRKSNGKPYSNTTLNIITFRLSIMLNYAVKYYGLPRNPMHVVGALGHRNQRHTFWTFDEFQRFLSHFEEQDARFKLIFEILFFSGMRIGELNALSLQDFDFEHNEISISKTYSTISNKITSPKTPSSVRKILMPPTIMKRIKAYVDGLPKIPAQLFNPSPKTLKNKIRRYAELAGIPPIHLHDFRHSHASYLIHSGVPITTISKRLGHSNPDMTLKIYSHMYDNSAKDVADMIEKDLH